MVVKLSLKFSGFKAVVFNYKLIRELRSSLDPRTKTANRATRATSSV